MTFVKAGTEALPMKKAAVKQLSRADSLIGNGREKRSRKDSTHFHPRLAGPAGATPRQCYSTSE
jgi:hypothetical protein